MADHDRSKAEQTAAEAQSGDIQTGDVRMDATTAALEEVQKVLFGAQIDDYDKKLSLLDRKLRNFIQTETATLELRLRGQIERIVSRMDQERKDRVKADEDVSEKLQRLQRTITSSMDDLVERIENERGSLRAEAVSRIDELQERFRKHSDSLSRQIDSGLDEMRTHKADTDALSGVLLDVATRLGELPDKGVKH